MGEQLAHLCRILSPGLTSWNKYEEACREAEKRLAGDHLQAFRDGPLTAAILHRSGTESLYAFSMACRHALRKNDLQAFLWTDRALRKVRLSLDAMQEAEHGMFLHYYRNDCFTNVGLTAQVLTGMRAYFRIRGDGTNQFDWERKYLIPQAETRVTLQSHITRQLDDETLAAGLRDVIPLEWIDA